MSVPYYGDFAEDAMVYIPFNTFDSNDPTASVTITNLADTDIYYHKNGSTTDYSADAATLVTIDFDSITGNHMLAIDTSENAYFSTGAEISVRMEGTTVDGGTINAFIGSFSIERAGGALALLKTINIANGAVESDLTYIHGTALTETAGQLAAGFVKLFDVATPLLVASDVMRGTDGANTTVPDAAGTAATPAEVATALTDIKLDHLIHTAAAEDEVADNSVIARLAATEGDWSEFNDENHSLEALRVRGDAAWTTGGGTGLTALATGTAQSGTASTIVLAAAAAFADDVLNGNVINIHTGTGAGQSRVILSNTLADDTCNVSPNWATNPSSDSQYEIVQGSSNTAAISLTAQTANDNGADINTLITGVDLNDDAITAAKIADNALANEHFADGALTSTEITSAGGCDVTSISGDSDAADNLEATYDGTGYTDDEAPATQSQMSNITNVGSAVNTPMTSYLLTTGNETANDEDDTVSLNGTRHTHTDAGGAMVLEYVFNVGAGTPSSVQITGALTGGNDDLEVMAYDYVSAGYVQIGILDGKNSTANRVFSYDLYTSMVGTGASIGEVNIRLRDGAYTLTSATLYIDQIYVSFSSATGSYNGAIWYDDTVSNTSTVPNIDGIDTNPVSTWAAALSLSAKTNINRFHIANGSSIELTASIANFDLISNGLFNLNLSGESAADAYIKHANVTGISSGSGAIFEDCRIGPSVSTGPSYFVRCGFNTPTGTPYTSNGNGEYVFVDCVSIVAGSATPYFNFAGEGAATGINNRRWAGGSNYTLDSDCTLSHEVLAGGGQTITTGGGDVELRGVCRAVTMVLSAAETAQFAGVTGPITLSGTTTATVNLFGVSGSLADSTSAATVTDNTVSGTDTSAILADTNELQTNQGDWATITGHATEAKQDTAQTDLDTLTDAAGEPGDGAPGVSASLVDKVAYLYKLARNKIETTATKIHVYDDAGTNKDHTSTISDDGTTFTRGEFGAGDA